MRRIFNQRKKSETANVEKEQTLDRIVRDKEGVKKRLEADEREFLNKKREYEHKMIEMEKQEVQRRQQEIEQKNNKLVELKMTNQMVRDKVEDQLKILHRKLKEINSEHMSKENNRQAVLDSLNRTLAEVNISLKQHLNSFQEETTGHHFPSAPDEKELQQASLLYPSLQNIPAMNRSWYQVYSAPNKSSSMRSISFSGVHYSQRNYMNDDIGSLGSSPQISLDSNNSSTSKTQAEDSDSSI